MQRGKRLAKPGVANSITLGIDGTTWFMVDRIKLAASIDTPGWNLRSLQYGRMYTKYKDF